MAIVDVFPQWLDARQLAELTPTAKLTDDFGRSTLEVGRVRNYWTERMVVAHDHLNNKSATLRYLCPLAGGGTQPYTLLSLYKLPAAMEHDAQLPLFWRGQAYVNEREIQHEVSRPSDSGSGGLSVQRLNRDWLALTVKNEHAFVGAGDGTVSLFFNRLRSPHVYQGLVCLAHSMRKDNRYFPVKSASQLAA